MNPSVEIVLRDNLKKLRLPTMLSSLDAHLRHASENTMSYEDFLLQLTEEEVKVRFEKKQKRYVKEAKFPIHKPLETFCATAAPELDFRLIKELSGSAFITSARNVIFLGRSGTGKTHLATALGIAACQNGYRTRFVTGCGLANELLESRDERTLSRTLKKYYRTDLLIVDELGYVPFSKEGAELLFQVFTERHEQKSVIITTNIGFADWTQIFGDANLTAALLDRLTHRAFIINCSWESYRLREALRSKKNRGDLDAEEGSRNAAKPH